jgi:hypothetical protein
MVSEVLVTQANNSVNRTVNAGVSSVRNHESRNAM